MNQEKIVTVFGSSRPREGEPDYEEARVLGRALAKHGFAVCSGGYGGVMEAVSRGAKEAGGKTYGVTAEFFTAARPNSWIDTEVRMKTWEERLFELIRMADGFVACKGGTGSRKDWIGGTRADAIGVCRDAERTAFDIFFLEQ